MPPHVGISSVPLLLMNNNNNNTTSTGRNYYTCSCNQQRLRSYRVSDDPSAICPACGGRMNVAVSYVAPPGKQASTAEGGFVKGVVTYMIMDNLVVKPMSTISSIALLNKFNVKFVGNLLEKEVTLGMNEALKLLKASLKSEKVLTDVFLNCK